MNNKIQVKEKEDFFLDVFNHILNYNEKTIMVIFDIDGNVWFKLKDLLKLF
jgi:hypothetical protein